MRKLALLAIFLLAPKIVAAQEVNFATDVIVYDRNTGMFSTIGAVDASFDDNKISADVLEFDSTKNTAASPGKTRIENPKATILASSVLMDTKDSTATIGEAEVDFKNGSSAVAGSGLMESQSRYSLLDVRYTTCRDGVKECNRPSWSIWASRIDNDRDAFTMSYWNMLLYIGPVPVFYMPYFQSYTSEIKNKSGLLHPNIGYSTVFGWKYRQPIFIKINPYNDFTFTPIFASKTEPWYRGQYRTNQSFFTSVVEGSWRPRLRPGDEVVANEPISHDRWYVNTDSLVEFSDMWRAKVHYERVSDTPYLRLYEQNAEPWLTSSVRVEGLDRRGFVTLSAIQYQDMRECMTYAAPITNPKCSSFVPQVLPVMEYEHISDVNRAGGYFKSTLASARIVRAYVPAYTAEGYLDPEYFRSTGIFAYSQPMKSPGGHLWTFEAQARGDLYALMGTEVEFDDTGRPTDYYSGGQARGNLSASAMWRYPMLAKGWGPAFIIEPQAQLITSPKLAPNDKIPNLDSNYMELSSLNLFSDNRFPGYDLLESGTRMNYGLNISRNYGSEGSFRFFLGQNYNLDVPDDIYFQNSGLANASGLSNVVTSMIWRPNSWFSLNGKLRVDRADWNLNSMDAQMAIGPSWFNVGANYMYLRSIYVEDQEPVKLHAVAGTVSLSIISGWSLRIGDRYDIILGKELSRSAALVYDDDCFRVTMSMTDNFARSELYGAERSYNLQFDFKGLGSVGTNQFDAYIKDAGL